MGLELKSLTREALLAAMVRQLGLASVESHPDELPIALVASVLRRIAINTCPCPREALVGCAIDSFTGLGATEAIKLRMRETLDSLIVIGDLLELGGSMSLPGVLADDWLYCAPPSFVVRDESILLLGIQPEDQASLPTALRTRVVHQRELRYIRTNGDQDADGIAAQLRTAGYLEISKIAWTRPPQKQAAGVFLEGTIRRLREANHRGVLEGLRVYAPASPGLRYASRLGPPTGRSGFHVGRRPQAFGAPLWVFVELEQGRPAHFLDLPWRGGKFRGCDHGWRILSALDALADQPQTYRVTPIDGDLDCYDFFSPLPLWIERKLKLHGEKVHTDGALFAYLLDRHGDHEIDDLVQSYMWFKQTN
ncbi:hypothetical protein [Xanthomonas sacchari]|uniref:hypothetical protein n=1 Tax=Xanthomonas sacchari TaxID=56458 RepID=UPI0020C35ED2|nr:hypothetical protein [Xanthomonas sacchari]